MGRSITRLVGALVAVICFVSPAWAACLQANLQGTWRVYLMAAAPEGAFWERCAVTVDATGNIRSGGACRLHDNTANTVTGGHLTLTSGCIVTGTVQTSLGSATVSHAALDRGKTVLSGVGTDDSGGIFMFNAIKR